MDRAVPVVADSSAIIESPASAPFLPSPASASGSHSVQVLPPADPGLKPEAVFISLCTLYDAYVSTEGGFLKARSPKSGTLASNSCLAGLAAKLTLWRSKGSCLVGSGNFCLTIPPPQAPVVGATGRVHLRENISNVYLNDSGFKFSSFEIQVVATLYHHDYYYWQY